MLSWSGHLYGVVEKLGELSAQPGGLGRSSTGVHGAHQVLRGGQAHRGLPHITVGGKRQWCSRAEENHSLGGCAVITATQLQCLQRCPAARQVDGHMEWQQPQGFLEADKIAARGGEQGEGLHSLSDWWQQSTLQSRCAGAGVGDTSSSRNRRAKQDSSNKNYKPWLPKALPDLSKATQSQKPLTGRDTSPSLLTVTAQLSLAGDSFLFSQTPQPEAWGSRCWES